MYKQLKGLQYESSYHTISGYVKEPSHGSLHCPTAIPSEVVSQFTISEIMIYATDQSGMIYKSNILA